MSDAPAAPDAHDEPAPCYERFEPLIFFGGALVLVITGIVLVVAEGLHCFPNAL